jgi:hypothetical protein
MDAGSATEKAQAEDGSGWRQRVDWRTGKTVAVRDDAFWKEQERRRREQGLSVAQYCQANGLALSTYRHRTSGRRRGRAASAAPTATPAPAASMEAAPARFIAVPAETPAAAAPGVEIVLEGMTLRLAGAAADRIIERVLERLA